jgi:hypothetical protein
MAICIKAAKGEAAPADWPPIPLDRPEIYVFSSVVGENELSGAF